MSSSVVEHERVDTEGSEGAVGRDDLDDLDDPLTLVGQDDDVACMSRFADRRFIL